VWLVVCDVHDGCIRSHKRLDLPNQRNTIFLNNNTRLPSVMRWVDLHQNTRESRAITKQIGSLDSDQQLSSHTLLLTNSDHNNNNNNAGASVVLVFSRALGCMQQHRLSIPQPRHLSHAWVSVEPGSIVVIQHQQQQQQQSNERMLRFGLTTIPTRSV